MLIPSQKQKVFLIFCFHGSYHFHNFTTPVTSDSYPCHQSNKHGTYFCHQRVICVIYLCHQRSQCFMFSSPERLSLEHSLPFRSLLCCESFVQEIQTSLKIMQILVNLIRSLCLTFWPMCLQLVQPCRQAVVDLS